MTVAWPAVAAPLLRGWTDRAACRGKPTSWWFPAQYENFVADVAKQICAACPVRRTCLAECLAQEHAHERHGIFGGMTASERGVMVRRRATIGRVLQTSASPE